MLSRDTYLEISENAVPSVQFSTKVAPCRCVTNWPSLRRFSIHFCRACFRSRVDWKVHSIVQGRSRQRSFWDVPFRRGAFCSPQDISGVCLFACRDPSLSQRLADVDPPVPEDERETRVSAREWSLLELKFVFDCSSLQVRYWSS